MNKYSLILCALGMLCGSCGSSGEKINPDEPGLFVEYSTLSETSVDLAGFIPDRWELLDSCAGDLNKDGLEDLVFVLQSKDTIPESYGNYAWHPRMTGIAFREPDTGRYRLVAQSNDFVISNMGDSAMEEPFVEMSVRKNGTLSFSFSLFMSMGGWETYHSTYIFRYQNDRFELIGREVGSFHRATHASRNESVNYSTGKAIVTIDEDGDHVSKTYTVSFNPGELDTFENIGLADYRFTMSYSEDGDSYEDCDCEEEGEFSGYPTLPATSRTLEGFIPDRWELLENGTGDLNKDGLPDIAFVLQSKDSIPAEYPEDFWSKPWYPRILGIAFWDADKRHYKLIEQSDEFVITNEGNGTMAEPFQGMSIPSNGTLHFSFHSWYSAGSWWMGNSRYIFRYQNGRFELIGQEIDSMHRASHASTMVSINYSTRKAILTTQEDGDSPQVTRNISFQCKELPTFQSIGAAGFVPEVDLCED